MIVKIQLSIYTTAENPQCLIYNKDRSSRLLLDEVPENIVQAMNNRPKAFFDINVIGNDINIISEVPDQGW